MASNQYQNIGKQLIATFLALKVTIEMVWADKNTLKFSYKGLIVSPVTTIVFLSYCN